MLKTDKNSRLRETLPIIRICVKKVAAHSNECAATVCLFPLCRYGGLGYALYAQEKYQYLRAQYSQEHGERVYCRVTDSRRVVPRCVVCKSKCWRVGCRTGNDTRKGIVVYFELQPCYYSDYQNGNHGYQETGPYVLNPVARNYGIPEIGSGLQSYGGEEQHQSHLA